ncbi:zinc dependent phospholipase C family protein [Chryseolinea sp. T2]|uniref:zinc dependent phospholipase C family protein n=1 Tax=Chryseolinea sp. T2 TaxID=3129255 RepID=UPI003078966B
MSLYTLVASLSVFWFSWGFYAHQEINELAVYTLPDGLIGFYKANLDYIREVAVNPDRRRHSVPEEAPRHYIDLDHYGDSALFKLPRNWNKAVEELTEDTLVAFGILPWHVNRMYFSLREAFLLRDPARILKLSSELGHYVGDAHVPLHTTENYNGQLTGQDGIHAFWESRLPEMFARDFNFLVGKATYVNDPLSAVWQAVTESNAAVDSVLNIEKSLSHDQPGSKFSFESKGRVTTKVYAESFSRTYHRRLHGMVERRMRAAIRMTGNLWFSAWTDAGQPDISLLNYQPTEEELAERKHELELWREKKIQARPHEGEP